MDTAFILSSLYTVRAGYHRLLGAIPYTGHELRSASDLRAIEVVDEGEPCVVSLAWSTPPRILRYGFHRTWYLPYVTPSTYLPVYAAQVPSYGVVLGRVHSRHFVYLIPWINYHYKNFRVLSVVLSTPGTMISRPLEDTVL